MFFLKINLLEINVDFVRVSMVEKMLLARHKKEVCGAILTGLSKAFDCISQDLLIVKLNAYRFDQNDLNVLHNYLFGRSRKTKVAFPLVIC